MLIAQNLCYQRYIFLERLIVSIGINLQNCTSKFFRRICHCFIIIVMKLMFWRKYFSSMCLGIIIFLSFFIISMCFNILGYAYYTGQGHFFLVFNGIVFNSDYTALGHLLVFLERIQCYYIYIKYKHHFHPLQEVVLHLNPFFDTLPYVNCY